MIGDCMTMGGAKKIEKGFEIHNTKFIGTKFSNGYEEIINDFQNAKQIRILTYGVPSNDSAKKLKILRALRNKDIRIIIGFTDIFYLKILLLHHFLDTYFQK